MEKILALLSEIKSFFTGASAKLDKVVASEEKAKALEADLTTAKQTISTLTTSLETEQAEHGKTRESLEKAQGEVNAAGTKVAELEKAVEEAKNKANEIVASQGLPADKTPKASVETNPAKPSAPGLADGLTGTARLLAAFGHK